MTPISANCSATAWLATNPGVNGPTRIPASKYPAMAEIRNLCARNPRTNAAANPLVNVRITVRSCIIGLLGSQLIPFFSSRYAYIGFGLGPRRAGCDRRGCHSGPAMGPG